MSENETQSSEQDTAARVMEWGADVAEALRVWAVTTTNSERRERCEMLAGQWATLRPELERLLARPTVPTVDSDTARRVAEIRERYLDVQKRHYNNGFLQSEDRVWALDTIKDLADTVDALLAERESVRAAALEEAADFVEQTDLLLRPVIADRIRSLKSAPAGEATVTEASA